MNTQRIYSILANVVQDGDFLGVFPRDKIPTLTPHSLAVANTDTHNQPGTHWIAIFTESDGDIEFFDSYGLPPSTYHFSQTFTSYNTTTLQSLTSTTCGHHCIYYLFHRSLGFSLPQILRTYTSNPNTNDQIVTHFIRKRLHPTPETIHSSLTNCQFTQSCSPRHSML